MYTTYVHISITTSTTSNNNNDFTYRTVYVHTSIKISKTNNYKFFISIFLSFTSHFSPIAEYVNTC